MAGVRFTAGSDRLREHVAERDAEAVRRMKKAGAIVLGKSSCSDMSGSMETDNPIIGRTRNPWRLREPPLVQRSRAGDHRSARRRRDDTASHPSAAAPEPAGMSE